MIIDKKECNMNITWWSTTLNIFIVSILPKACNTLSIQWPFTNHSFVHFIFYCRCRGVIWAICKGSVISWQGKLCSCPFVRRIGRIIAINPKTWVFLFIIFAKFIFFPIILESGKDIGIFFKQIFFRISQCAFQRSRKWNKLHVTNDFRRTCVDHFLYLSQCSPSINLSYFHLWFINIRRKRRTFRISMILCHHRKFWFNIRVCMSSSLNWHRSAWAE